jgi:AcrR family transcriptional regulator
LRKDAQENRDRLISAASAVMREGSGDVPMELIAERANVTRGTLYRNFPHRQAMYEAVLERDLENLKRSIADDVGDKPLLFIRRTAELMMVYDRFLVQLAEMADYDAPANEARMADVLDSPLADAQRSGLLRSDLTSSDILMACRMLSSHWKLDATTNFGTAFDRRLALLLHGLAGERDTPSPCSAQHSR